MKATEIIAKDLEEIYIGNLNTVEADLQLPEKGRNGSTFTWESKEILFISHEGKVTRPSHGVGNRKVVLEVCAEYEGEKATKSFEVTVLEEPRKIKIVEVEDVKVEAAFGERAELPPVVIVTEETGDFITLPVVWEDYEPCSEEKTIIVNGEIEGEEMQAKASISYRLECTEKEKEYRTDIVESFAPGTVRLLKGTVFAEAQERMFSFIRSVDADELLYNFRIAAGLDTKGAEPMTGWDAPDCKLKGHTTGHYLSGIALAYSVTGEEELKEKLDYLVEELAKCQQGLEEKGWHKGFLSAYGEEQFDLLEEYTKYPTIWAPYYTLDKILSGLYDCYMLAGNETALTILKGAGQWVYDRLSRLTREQRDKMWSMYIAGEFGGMIGILVKLYRATGEKIYAQAAEYFQNEKLFYPMAENKDTLKDMHANQHIPQIIGALEMFKATGEKRDFLIADSFWHMVSGHHTYTIGGTGETEMFHAPDHLVDFISDKTAESCATYNMLRLTSGLFRLNPKASMMDYYEIGLYNHLMASASHTCDGGTTYFMPLRPGSQKIFDTDENTCCHGTGLESRFRYMEDIYMKNDNCVYVNLYIPSQVSIQDFFMKQEITVDGVHKFAIETCGEQEIAFRVPAWGKECVVVVNGERFTKRNSDGYIHVKREWKVEDEVVIELSYEFRFAVSNDDERYVSVAYGPYILAELSEEETYRKAPDLSRMERVMDGNHLRFMEGNRIFVPMADIAEEKYHAYFLRT